MPKNVKNNTKNKKEKKSFMEYFRGVKLELSKVVWPTREELGSFAAIVLISCAAFTLLFWLVDTGFLAALKAVLGITLE
ncbi:MAG: preprotein translocase subunit SecE [Clostridia bacterium]|nr:preprotein translocase subunit SecE [Clostridia bacterium]